MSDATTLKNLEARVKRLEKRKKTLDELLTALHVVIRMYKEDRQVDTSSYQEGSHAQMLSDAIEDILATHGPLHRNVICERVQERGIYIGAVKPVSSIGSYLSTDIRFMNVGKGIWDLAEKKARINQNGRSHHVIAVHPTQAAIMPTGDPDD